MKNGEWQNMQVRGTLLHQQLDRYMSMTMPELERERLRLINLLVDLKQTSVAVAASGDGALIRRTIKEMTTTDLMLGFVCYLVGVVKPEIRV